MLQGRPLLATAADAALFVDREQELAQLQRSIRRGFNVAIRGERGVGMSSLLHQLAYRERAGRHIVYVDGDGAEDAGELVERIRRAVMARSEAYGYATATAELTLGARPELPGAASSRLAEQVRLLADVPAMVVLIDTSTAAEAVYGLFGRLRDELWQLEHRWIVGVDERDWPQVDRPPADAFFDVMLALPPLDDDGMLEVLGRRTDELPKADLAAIVTQSGGNPRRALELVRHALISERSVDGVLMARALREAAAARLGRPHSMLLAELENSGEPLSPSDQTLLDSMAWTRERAGQVFRELEQAGVVASTQERRSRGRPRKLYFPNPEYTG